MFNITFPTCILRAIQCDLPIRLVVLQGPRRFRKEINLILAMLGLLCLPSFFKDGTTEQRGPGSVERYII